jgi:hypothetical protein
MLFKPLAAIIARFVDDDRQFANAGRTEALKSVIN